MATGEWRTVLLSDVMRLEREAVKVDPSVEYPNLGIYSFGKGVFPKSPISGAATSAPTLYRVRAGQFIYSRLFAFEGSFALVPPEMNGWYVSNEYPTFDVDESKALPEFLRLTICRRAAWEELAAMTVGMGHRRQRLQPDAFLAFEIDLPPLEEQRRIVAAVAAADGLAQAAAAEAEAGRALALALHDALSDSTAWRRIALGEVMSRPERAKPKPTEGEVPLLGVRLYGQGAYEASRKAASDVKSATLYRVCSGDFIYNRMWATRGTFAIVPPELDGHYATNEFPMFVADEDRLLLPYLALVAQTPPFLAEVDAAAVGSTARRRLHPERFLELEIELPPIEEQRKITAASSAAAAAEREADSARSVRGALSERLLAHVAEEFVA